MFGLASLSSVASGALGILGKIPIWSWFLAAALAWGWLGNHKASALQRDWAKEKEAISVATARDEALHRAEERRREIEKEGVVRGLTKKLELARTASVVELSRTAQLQRDIAALRAGGAVSGNPTLVPAGEAAERLGEVAARCVERLRVVVDAARRANVAGAGCEAQYDTLTLLPPPSTKK